MLHTRLRPHCKEFLEKIAKLYELHVFTFGSRLYAHTIAGKQYSALIVIPIIVRLFFSNFSNLFASKLLIMMLLKSKNISISVMYSFLTILYRQTLLNDPNWDRISVTSTMQMLGKTSRGYIIQQQQFQQSRFLSLDEVILLLCFAHLHLNSPQLYTRSYICLFGHPAHHCHHLLLQPSTTPTDLHHLLPSIIDEVHLVKTAAGLWGDQKGELKHTLWL